MPTLAMEAKEMADHQYFEDGLDTQKEQYRCR